MSGNDSACGHPVNSNGNCFDGNCWNSNSKRNDGIGRSHRCHLQKHGTPTSE